LNLFRMMKTMMMMMMLAVLLQSSNAYLLVPQVPQLYFTSPYTIPQYIVPQLYLNSFGPGAGPVFRPVSSGSVEESDPVLPAATIYAGRSNPRTVDLCYFLGNDITKSHVACNKDWADGTAAGVKKYINELTFDANKVLGAKNLKLAWKGPFVRHDADTSRYPSNPAQDTFSVSKEGCDAVVFLVFNEFKSDCTSAVAGHQYGGITQGGMCEAGQGSGYTVVVDQGFLDDVWTGPMILAHHLVKLLIADLPAKQQTCPNKDSLLFPELRPGKQRVDRCVVQKLNQSKVSLRPCLQN